jgi:FMN phosphatase YigB (HAD superfamily)
MPQSDRIILTDVDGVLLEWEDHFSKWMATKGFPQLENTEHEYDMSVRYGIHRDLSRELIREFNKSAWMSTQLPMPDAQTWIKLLHAEGWTFIPITSQTSDIPAQELRKRRLAELFGGTVFTNYFILGPQNEKNY